MKLYAMSDLLQNVENRYLLVNAIAHRAREIAVQAEMENVSLEEKPVTLAMEEASRGELVIPSLMIAELNEEEGASPAEETLPE